MRLNFYRGTPGMTDWTSGKVVNNRHWTDNLFSLTIDADIAPFRAGQYTSLALDIDGQRISDPYSILSAPDERPLEFFFYTRLEGDLSTALTRLQSGDSVWIGHQPAGGFTLETVPDSDELWLLATGTGVAPFLSMLKTGEPWQRFRQIVLVYAVRYHQDLRYQELFDELHLRYPGRFTFIPVVSREAIPDTLDGHIPELLAAGTLQRVSGRALTPAESQVMLCGNPGMIRDTVSLLRQAGFRDGDRNEGAHGQLHYESYW
jgi:ferredoxin--NADP+ reductase